MPSTCYKHLLLRIPLFGRLTGSETLNRNGKNERNDETMHPNGICQTELDRCAESCGMHGEMSLMKLAILGISYDTNELDNDVAAIVVQCSVLVRSNVSTPVGLFEMG